MPQVSESSFLFSLRTKTISRVLGKSTLESTSENIKTQKENKLLTLCCCVCASDYLCTFMHRGFSFKSLSRDIDTKRRIHHGNLAIYLFFSTNVTTELNTYYIIKSPGSHTMLPCYLAINKESCYNLFEIHSRLVHYIAKVFRRID